VRRTIPKNIAAICVSLILGIALLIVLQTKQQNFPLTVEVTPVESTYSLAKYWHTELTVNEPPSNAFMVHFRVSNPSSTPCAIAVMTCSYFQCWGTDGTNVFVPGWGCDGNFPYGIPLFSTNVYSGEVPIGVLKNTKPGQLSFRMCFKSLKKEDCDDNWSRSQTNWADGKYWSNEIKITVVP
jgi:hypothetical protein